MVKINIKDPQFVQTFAEWACESYIKLCNQSDPKQWHAQAAGYPNGDVELYNIQYGCGTSEDIYYSRAHQLIDIYGEDYQYIELDPDDDIDDIDELIDELIYEQALMDYCSDADNILGAIAHYREWLSDLK